MGRYSSGVRPPRSTPSTGVSASSSSYQLVAGGVVPSTIQMMGHAPREPCYRMVRRSDEEIEVYRGSGAVLPQLTLDSDFPLTHAFTGRQYQRPDLNSAAAATGVRGAPILLGHATTPAPVLLEPRSTSDTVVVDGCGGHCVTCEHVCSYVLQVVFVLGALTGVSLCIAGVALRRTRSKDLQVLRYIGAMGALVCGALLAVQCRVRNALRRRKRAAPHAALELRHLHPTTLLS